MCGAGFRHCGGDQRALRSPSGLLRLPHLSILAVIAAFLVSTPFVLLSNDKNQETWECSAKVSKGRPQTSFVFMPFGRVRRRETLCNQKNQVTSKEKNHEKSAKKAACLRAFAKTDGFKSQIRRMQLFQNLTPQRIDIIQLLPRHVRLAEMTVVAVRAVNRAAQVQPLNDGVRAQVE